MTEARDVEGIVKEWEASPDYAAFGTLVYVDAGMLRALIADWRAKKAALSEAILQLEYLHERWPTGTGEAVLMHLRQDPPPPPQSTAYPDDSQDGQA